jgi:hypothetical protein
MRYFFKGFHYQYGYETMTNRPDFNMFKVESTNTLCRSVSKPKALCFSYFADKPGMISLLLLLATTLSQATLAEDCPSPLVNSTLSSSLVNNLNVTSAMQSLPLDNLGTGWDVSVYQERMLGFSYFIGKGNERFEKLEGYDDIYLMIDHYVPNKHQLNTLFLGSHTVVKYDRSVNPPNVIYLSKQKHIAGKPYEEMRKYQSVDETLCSLNTSCSKKLPNFNKIVDSAEFNSKAVPQYKNAIIDRLTDRLLIDVYHQKPVLKEKIKNVLELVRTKSFSNMAEINTFIEQEMTKITQDKLQGRTAQQYKAYIQKEKPNEDWLEYYDYNAIVPNINPDIKNNSFVSKKKAIFDYCAANSSASCGDINSLKTDLDHFHSKRKEIPDWP